MAQIGQMIDGRFRILRMLDRGGMSRIYLADDVRLSKTWVVKEIPKNANGRDQSLFIQAALKEAAIIRHLDHPAIVRIVDIAQDEHALYIVEDYVQGKSLHAFLREARRGHASSLTRERLLDWALQICEVLLYLHSRNPPVIYRDIKPENLILSESGHIRLIDFGTARYYDPEKRRDTEYLGTECYAAPEQFEAYGAQTDARTDLFGFGKTLEQLARACPDSAPAFHAVIRKCLQSDPDRRYQSAGELMEALQKIRLHGSSARQKGRMRLGRRRARLRLLMAALCSAILISAVILLAGVFPTGSVHRTLPLSQVLEMAFTMGADLHFEKEEEEQLLNAVMSDLSELQKEEGFEELAYQIGTMYWYFYNYDSDNLTGMAAAVPWFRMAGGFSDLAHAYEILGEFLQSRHRMDPQSDAPGVYRDCFAQLSLLASELLQPDLTGRMQGQADFPAQAQIQPDAASWMRAETDRFILHFLDVYQEQLQRDGVEAAELEALRQTVHARAEADESFEQEGGAGFEK